MVRAAVLASGDGGRLQAILDAMYFKEIPDFELVAVICPQRGCNAMKPTAWPWPTSSRTWTLSW